ncbi:hypothetical protein [Bartonella doshiae]|uniref:Uncharacterized protein n=2 Tax=Bartonella doshiae TaxID=33044 RepID=A0A380ZHE9_BARDO|nr:hypothetical protein [Bartonella doshiae]EJF80040.1 hypothetical protein MCS_01235 [Bartonella doshiae NCTC 12862 = ATCC 700133]MBB6158895.1 hypothetical protein [Bartonella doshiae]SUV45605.1 Uncharacterised protein [Bartonella doshiae]
MVGNYIFKQSEPNIEADANPGVTPVADLIEMEAGIFGLFAYFLYLYHIAKNSTHTKARKTYDAFVQSTWLVP